MIEQNKHTIRTVRKGDNAMKKNIELESRKILCSRLAVEQQFNCWTDVKMHSCFMWQFLHVLACQRWRRKRSSPRTSLSWWYARPWGQQTDIETENAQFVRRRRHCILKFMYKYIILQVIL